MVRMADTQASEHGRELARARWGSQAVDRAAQVVISRAAEVSPELRAELHEVTAPAGERDGSG
jgi:hypothetical protein